MVCGDMMTRKSLVYNNKYHVLVVRVADTSSWDYVSIPSARSSLPLVFELFFCYVFLLISNSIPPPNFFCTEE